MCFVWRHLKGKWLQKKRQKMLCHLTTTASENGNRKSVEAKCINIAKGIGNFVCVCVFVFLLSLHIIKQSDTRHKL